MRFNMTALSMILAVTCLAAPSLRAQSTPAALSWYDLDRGREITDEGPRPSLGKRALLYPVSRLADFLDIISLQVGFGFGAHVNGHATRAMQFGLGASGVQRLGFDGRKVGVVSESKSEFSLFLLTTEHFSREATLGAFRDYEGRADLPWRYHGHRDYWGLGAEVTAGVVNVGFEMHPTQLVDAVAGFAGVDIMGDDFGSRGPKNDKRHLSEAEVNAIKRVVVVSSRVTRHKDTRMAQDGGVGVYYHRFPREAFLGKLGSWTGSSQDRAAGRELSSYVQQRDYDIHRELVERAERSLTVYQGWEVVGAEEALEAFGKHSVVKTGRAAHIRRLPNYRGLAEYYAADAVMDIRVWEWGVWRDKKRALAAMRLDCEYKIIAYPKADATGAHTNGKILFDTRVLSYQGDKPGKNILEFAKEEGKALVAESKEACDLVHAQIADYLVETR